MRISFLIVLLCGLWVRDATFLESNRNPEHNDDFDKLSVDSMYRGSCGFEVVDLAYLGDWKNGIKYDNFNFSINHSVEENLRTVTLRVGGSFTRSNLCAAYYINYQLRAMGAHSRRQVKEICYSEDLKNTNSLENCLDVLNAYGCMTCFKFDSITLATNTQTNRWTTDGGTMTTIDTTSTTGSTGTTTSNVHVSTLPIMSTVTTAGGGGLELKYYVDQANFGALVLSCFALLSIFVAGDAIFVGRNIRKLGLSQRYVVAITFYVIMKNAALMMVFLILLALVYGRC
jgi:hypothetical protein